MRIPKNIIYLIFIFSFIILGANTIFQNSQLSFKKNLCLFTQSKVENDISFFEEHEVINKVFDSILNIEYCYPIIKIKKNADLDYINAVRKRNFISKKEIDTIRKFGIIDTKSMVSYDFKGQKDYLIKELSKITKDSDFFQKMEFILNKGELDSELIKKRGVELFTEIEANKKELNPKWFGKRNSILNIGRVNFSRVYYSKKNNLGIFYYYRCQTCITT